MECVLSIVELINATTKQPSDETQMSWLKTTVYAVIGCTVGTVLLISVIVIIVFRFRMKSSLRSTERALRRYHMTVNSRSQQDGNQNAIEMDPFLSSSATYGNIIVNVNNGVQYIPRSEFSTVGVPPSYSDVEREITRERGSPPPVYSTIDRNPPQEVINFNNYIIQDSSISIATACAPCLPSLSRDSSILSESELCVPQTIPMSSTCTVSVQTCCDDPEAGRRRRLSQSCQCQSITVQNGAILLAAESNVAPSEPSQCSLPESCHVECVSCPRVCQLNVQDGAIVLTGQNVSGGSACETCVGSRADENLRGESRSNASSGRCCSSPESSPSHIQVEGGQIVLRGNKLPTINAMSSQQTEGTSGSEPHPSVSDSQVDPN